LQSKGCGDTLLRRTLSDVLIYCRSSKRNAVLEMYSEAVKDIRTVVLEEAFEAHYSLKKHLLENIT
jgi:hypothetical protein